MKKLILIGLIWFCAIGWIAPPTEQEEQVFKTVVAKHIVKVWEMEKNFPDFSLLQEIQEVNLIRVETISDVSVYSMDVRFAIVFFDKEGIFDKTLMIQRWYVAVKSGQVLEEACETQDAERIKES